MSAVANPPKPEATNPAVSEWMKGLPALEPQAGSVGAIAPNPNPPPTPEPAPAPVPDPAKPAVEPAKPAAVEDDESKWPRSAKDWDAFKSKRKEKEALLVKERDEIKIERDRLNEEIATLKKQGPSPELESLKKERDEYEQQLRLYSVENHPKFKAYFEGKTNAQLELAKRIVGPDNAEAAAKALALPEGEYRDARLEELMGNLTPMQSTRLGGVLNALSEIGAERQSEVAKGRENFDKMMAEQKAGADRIQAENTKAANEAVNAVIAQAQDPKSGLFLFQKKEGNEAWNKEVDARIAAFKHLSLGPATREQRVMACRNAAAFPAIVKYAQERDAEVATLKEQVKALSAAQPGAGSGNEPPAGDAPPAKLAVNPGTRPMDVTKAWTANVRALRP